MDPLTGIFNEIKMSGFPIYYNEMHHEER